MFIVSSTFFKRKDVVNFFGGGQTLSLQTLLAEWVSLDVPITNAPPLGAVSFRGIIGALVLVVAGVHYLGVFLAIPVVSEEGTAGEATGFLGLSWHWGTLLNNKSPYGFPHRLRFYSFAIIVYHKGKDDIS